LHGRVRRVEAQVAALRSEVRTGRLVIDDGHGERIVAELRHGVAELRIDLGTGEPYRTSGVVIFAASAADDLPAALGVQLWGDGDALVELNISEDLVARRWRADVQLEPPLSD
jgi:hypothetical protein